MIVYFTMSCKVYVKEAIRFVEKRILNFKLSYLSIRRNGNDIPIFSSTKSLERGNQKWICEDEITLHINLI